MGVVNVRSPKLWSFSGLRATQVPVRTRWDHRKPVMACSASRCLCHLWRRPGSGAIHTPGADLRNCIPVEPLVGHIMKSFPHLVHLVILGHVVVGLQWPFGTSNSQKADTNSQPSTTGRRAYDRLGPGPILTLDGCSADIAELLPAEIDAVIQNMGQRSTHHHYTQHNLSPHI